MSEPSFAAPGPGRWELDRSHFPGGTTAIVSDLMSTAMAAGIRRSFAELGMPADTLDCRFVNGFCYTRLRPLIGADKPPRKAPPKIVLKVAVRVHPEMRRRAKAAARALQDRPWRPVIAGWQDGGRAALQRKNLALQDVELGALDDAALVAHLTAVVAHLRSSLEQHFWLHGYDIGPIAMLLSEARPWGIATNELVPLLEGASPSTSEPVRLLASLRAMVDASGTAPTTLDEVRAISPEADAALTDYLHYRRALLFSQYDLDGRTLGEVPALVLATIMASEHRDRSAAIAEATATVRAKVPAEHAFELRLDELNPTLLPDGGPAREELRRRADARRSLAQLTPPDALGPEEPPPPLDVLPGPLAELVSMVQVALVEMGMAAKDRSGDPLVGSGVGTEAYTGTARCASTPEEAMDAMEPGDVLVVPCTTPAYNVVLAIAGAIVTADGGPLSHAAVLARELGIPAVVGAPGALSIEDGSTVEVDPVAGVVRIVSSPTLGQSSAESALS